MFSRIVINGHIISGPNGSMWCDEHSWKLLSSTIEFKELYLNGVALHDDLSDPYALYDRFSALKSPDLALETFLETVVNLPSLEKEKILDGFNNYLLSFN
jgi:hypothetical protein